jgi:hypothetical protein
MQNTRSVRPPTYLHEHMFSPTADPRSAKRSLREAVRRAVDLAVAFATLSDEPLPRRHADDLAEHRHRDAPARCRSGRRAARRQWRTARGAGAAPPHQACGDFLKRPAGRPRRTGGQQQTAVPSERAATRRPAARPASEPSSSRASPAAQRNATGLTPAVAGVRGTENAGRSAARRRGRQACPCSEAAPARSKATAGAVAARTSPSLADMSTRRADQARPLPRHVRRKAPAGENRDLTTKSHPLRSGSSN